MEASKPKSLNSISNTIGVNSLRLGGLNLDVLKTFVSKIKSFVHFLKEKSLISSLLIKVLYLYCAEKIQRIKTLYNLFIYSFCLENKDLWRPSSLNELIPHLI